MAKLAHPGRATRDGCIHVVGNDVEGEFGGALVVNRPRLDRGTCTRWEEVRCSTLMVRNPALSLPETPTSA